MFSHHDDCLKGKIIKYPHNKKLQRKNKSIEFYFIFPAKNSLTQRVHIHICLHTRQKIKINLQEKKKKRRK